MPGATAAVVGPSELLTCRPRAQAGAARHQQCHYSRDQRTHLPIRSPSGLYSQPNISLSSLYANLISRMLF